MEKKVVGWFEIPVEDMDRAVKFYSTVFGYDMQRNPVGPLDMALFMSIDEGIGAAGALVKHPDFYKPSQEGTLVYFIAKSGDLSNELAKVEAAGGKIFVPKTPISEEVGYMAVFYDTEGNRVAMHSKK